MSPVGFEILYDQGPCLVVNKPGGVLTQAPPGIDSLEVRLKRFVRARNAAAKVSEGASAAAEGAAADPYLGVPHRLDRPVSGAMVFALSRRAAQALAEQFELRLVKKTYWALVSGAGLAAAGTWRDFVRKIPNQAQAEIVAADHPEGREAVLHYRVIGQPGENVSLIEIELETGRMHQIRVQAASHGHPVLGDAQYGSAVAFGPQTVDVRDRFIALHARELAFKHPKTREPVSVTAPLPACWEAMGVPSAEFGKETHSPR